MQWSESWRGRSQLGPAVPQAAAVQCELKNIILPDERMHQREQVVAWRQRRNVMLDSALEERKHANLARKAVASLLLSTANERAKLHVRSLSVAQDLHATKSFHSLNLNLDMWCRCNKLRQFDGCKWHMPSS
jgi:hypothetical protein